MNVPGEAVLRPARGPGSLKRPREIAAAAALAALAVLVGLDLRLAALALAVFALAFFVMAMDRWPGGVTAFLIFCIPVMPEIQLAEFFPIFRADEYLLYLFFFFLLARNMARGAVAFRFHAFDGLFFLFLAAHSISLLVGPVFVGRVTVYFTDYFNLAKWVQQYAFYRLVLARAKDEKQIRTFLLAYLYGAVFTVFLGLFQAVGFAPARSLIGLVYQREQEAGFALLPLFDLKDIQMAASVFAERNEFGNFSALLCALFFFASKFCFRKAGARWIMASLSLTSGAACLLSATRIGFVELAAGMFLLFLKTDKKWLVLGGGAVIYLFQAVGDSVYSIWRIAEIFSADDLTKIDTVAVRFGKWPDLIQQALSSPLFGHGGGAGFQTHFTDNYYIDLLLRTGTIGTGLFLTMNAYLAFLAARNMTRLGSGRFLGALNFMAVVFLVQLFISFITMPFGTRTQELYWLMCALVVASSQIPRDGLDPRVRPAQ